MAVLEAGFYWHYTCWSHFPPQIPLSWAATPNLQEFPNWSWKPYVPVSTTNAYNGGGENYAPDHELPERSRGQNFLLLVEIMRVNSI